MTKRQKLQVVDPKGRVWVVWNQKSTKRTGKPVELRRPARNYNRAHYAAYVTEYQLAKMFKPVDGGAI